MRLLFIHNHYARRSGEEVMLDLIIEMLCNRGHRVDTHFAYSGSIQTAAQKLGAAVAGVWSSGSRKALRLKVAETRPDLIQIQNLYPLISPSILPVLKASGVPVVMRLSNYRLICPNGLFLSHGTLCERCRGGREFNCLRQNCEDSRAKSASYALRNWVARAAGLYRKNVTRYYAQTAFQRDIHVAEGFDGNRIDVIPNMIDAPARAPKWTPGDYVGFVGRLSPEKGIDTLLAAARSCADIPFRLAGDPGRYNGQCTPGNVTLVGHLDAGALAQFYRDAAMIIVPSLWYEGFPSVIIEAMRHARPVIASRIGGLPEIVENGVSGQTVMPGDAAALASSIRDLWDAPLMRRQMGGKALRRVRESYSPDAYYDRLMQTYDKAMRDR